jgi:hemerythrin-like domain-containing protein
MPVTLGGKPQAGFDDPFGSLSDCHRRIEMFLGVLTRVAAALPQRVLAPDERAALERALDYFRDAAPKHTADEERSLFPRLRSCRTPEAEAAVRALKALEEDHRVADELHAVVDRIGRRIVAQGQAPAGEGEAFADAAGRLERIYAGHIEVEDRQLFPAAKRLLSEAEKASLGHEMAERRSIVRYNPRM